MTEAAAEPATREPRKAPQGLLRDLLSNGAKAGVIKVAAVSLSYLFLVVLARNVSEAEYGRYGFAISLLLFLGVLAHGGQPMAILRFWPQFLGQEDPARAKGALVLGFRTVMAASLAVMLLAALAISLAKLVYPQLETGYLYATALMILPAGLAGFQSSALRAQGSVVGAMLPSGVLHRGGLFLALLLLLHWGKVVTAETILWISALVWFLVLIPQTVGVLAGARKSVALQAADTRIPGWRSSCAVFLALALLESLSHSSDVVILGLYLGPEQTGGYFVALKVAMLFLMFFGAVNILTGPMISRAFHSGDLAEVQRICRTISGLMLLPALLGLAILVFAGRQVLGLFGPAYAEAHLLMIVLATGTASVVLAGPSAAVLMMTGHEQTLLKIQAVSRVSMVVTQIALVPLLGPLGAALGHAFWSIVLCLSTRHLVRRRLGVEPSVASLLPGQAKAVDARP